MNARALLSVIVMSITGPAVLAAAPSILLIGHSHRTSGDHTVVSGSVTAMVKGTTEQTRVTADAIAFDSATNALECTGAAVIETNGRTISGKDISIRLGAERADVFVLNENGVRVLPAVGTPARPGPSPAALPAAK